MLDFFFCLFYLITNFYMSYLSKQKLSLPIIQCHLYSDGEICEVHDVVVCPRTVVTGSALNHRTWQNCGVIDGDLVIYRLNDDVTESDLAFLKTIEWVYGEIVVQEAPGIYSLSFLTQIRVARRIVLRDNYNIFDAFLPTIHPEGLDVLVENCPMLCPSNYPVPQSLGELVCNSPVLTFQLDALVTISNAVNASFQVEIFSCFSFKGFFYYFFCLQNVYKPFSHLFFLNHLSSIIDTPRTPWSCLSPIQAALCSISHWISAPCTLVGLNIKFQRLFQERNLQD